MSAEVKIEKSLWGPWSPTLTDPVERKAQLRSLAAIVYILRVEDGHDPAPLVRAMREAESEFDWKGDLDRARRLFDLLPALHQRKIIATFAAVNYAKTETDDGKTA